VSDPVAGGGPSCRAHQQVWTEERSAYEQSVGVSGSRTWVSSAEAEQEAERPPLEAIAQANRKRRKTHPGRQTLPADLPRVEQVIVCTPEQCVCTGCGKECSVIGYDESERLDVEPAKYFVIRTRRESGLASIATRTRLSLRCWLSRSSRRVWYRIAS